MTIKWNQAIKYTNSKLKHVQHVGACFKLKTLRCNY